MQQADEVQVARCELRGANCAKGCAYATPKGEALQSLGEPSSAGRDRFEVKKQVNK